ncbi:methyltransferase, FxLD system [Micromonospora sp. WMMA1363]|uniref:methyltransferase, FxLD system n=1 Tax=Micromonospora sp. WMMA1363 TaxID=3053985 RepID=UPI00259C73AD|nr:methyltransferase, FxLD system [Micromonospora sp. WMMA1363]MDM4723298.1 methyltransferase, FxLD system [Micromonospora sp. WMMA1363]MDM4723392.1 methyltransferase, FxLD system [Micromonospora sp. WMMA1363]
MTSVQDPVQDPAVLRAAMVDALRTDPAVSDRVAAAFATVPRHLFAGGEPLARVYDPNTTLAPKVDDAGRETSVVSAAHIQAVMLEQAQIEPAMTVLEIGSSGYNAALIAELVGDRGAVTTVDIDPEIVTRATRNLRAAGYEQVRVVQADAEHGVPQHGPYDVIMVTVGAYDCPPAWRNQLSEHGRIVVPLRFAGITRLIAFDRDGDRLVGDRYRLGAFVPMQGNGAATDQMVPITGEVTLRLDTCELADFDVPALRKAVHSSGIERWSGAPFDLPDELELFLLTHGRKPVPMLHVSENMVQQGVFAASARRGVPALIEGGSFAYRTKRESPETGGFETGVIAHGPDAETVAARYIELLRRWARDYRRRDAARIEYLPAGADTKHLTGWSTTKRHGTVTVTWP